MPVNVLNRRLVPPCDVVDGQIKGFANNGWPVDNLGQVAAILAEYEAVDQMGCQPQLGRAVENATTGEHVTQNSPGRLQAQHR